MQITVNYLTCFKVLCYLQSGKIWAVLQNQYIFAKNYHSHMHWSTGRADILYKNLKYIFNFERGFCIFETHSKSLSQILFQIGNINIFFLHGFFYSRSVRLKSTFSDVVALQSCS